MSPEAGNARPLPKFGEWDVNNPASAESFTVIFNNARDQKKSEGLPSNGAHVYKNKSNKETKPDHHQKRVFCCFYGS